LSEWMREVDMEIIQVAYVFLLVKLSIEVHFEIYSAAAVTFLILLGFTIHHGDVLFGG